MTVTINGKKYEAEAGKTVLVAVSEAGIPFDAPCGGRRVCGKCKMKISGAVSEMTEEEREHLTEEEIKAGIRLACFCEIKGNVTVETLKKSFEIASDTDIGNKYKRDFFPEGSLGVAIDIGTTTVVVTVFDLFTGKRIYVASDINAQKGYGADVMSRIGFSVDGGGETLKNAIVGQINSLLTASGLDMKKIVRMTVAGNTCMELIAAGYSVNSLAALPFEPESYLGKFIPAASLGYVCENAEIYFMPCCGGFFGGDAVSVMTFCDFESGFSYMADIGTNGEMAICRDGKIFGCSTAAGPAFEGASIRFGTGSVIGAIRSCDADMNLKTIGDGPVCGICGSGLIDITAVCLDKGLIDETGLIESDDEFDGDEAVRIADGIYFTQQDVREIQLAKSAICAGTNVLTENIGGEPDNVFIAGGFGSSINMKNAGRIGLLPQKLCDKAVSVGNAALAGAQICLLSSEAREKAERIAAKTEITDLSSSPLFMDEYVENMIFE